MSLRRTPRTLDEVVAHMEERFRRLDGDQRVEPTDTRFLYSARGDILLAVAANEPAPLHVPTVTPPGPGLIVLAFSPSAPGSARWTWLPGVTGVPL